MPNSNDDYYDAVFEEMIPWRDFTPEEYLARHWIEIGAFSITKNKFRNKEMEQWAHRFEVLFHDPEQIEVCRSQFLSTEERAEQDRLLRKIDENGF
jgi:hypothetical protein